MRILVLGAGGIGGYFGGRLVEKGEDVTFLVRNKRKHLLEKNGLVIHSVKGDISFTPKLITKIDNTDPFDIVLLSSKAYHLKDAINDLKPFVGDKTVIIPLLNGVAHISPLIEAFGDHKVIGGLCIIETTLNKTGEIVHSSAFDQLVFGELEHQETDRIQQIADTFSGTKANLGDKTVIIPLLNGVAHISPLIEAFGDHKVIGGLCIIETTLNKTGEIVHSSAFDQLVFGELEHQETDRIQQIADTFSGTKANFVLSNQIMQDMWHKYLLITVMSGVTTLMRAPIGPIRASDGGRDFIRLVFQEATKIMRACKAPIADHIEEEHVKSIESLSYHFKTSMQ